MRVKKERKKKMWLNYINGFKISIIIFTHISFGYSLHETRWQISSRGIENRSKWRNRKAGWDGPVTYATCSQLEDVRTVLGQPCCRLSEASSGNIFISSEKNIGLPRQMSPSISAGEASSPLKKSRLCEHLFQRDVILTSLEIKIYTAVT